MARNFLSYPFGPYAGVYTSKAFNNATGQKKGEMVALSVLWNLYNVGIEPLGSLNPNFAVAFNLNTAGPNTVSGTWTVQSVYIDNENVDFPVYVYFSDTQFSISCPPNSAGWYPVYTNSRQGLITGVGIDDLAILNGQRTRVFFTDVLMFPSLDQEVQSAAELRLASPAISINGSGGALIGINTLAIGSGYTGGVLSISGDGVGATAHGTVDQFGRITNLFIDTPGTGYTFMTIKAASAQNSILPWISGQVYAAGNIVSWLGFYYQANSAITANRYISPDQNNEWNFTGIAVNAAASFTANLSPITGGITLRQSSNYGVAALGDQTRNYVNTVSALGVFENNLFSTPQSSGFIYLTHIYVSQLNSAAGSTWQLEDQNGDALFSFASQSSPGPLLNLQGANIKLPAASTWRLNLTSGAANNSILNHAFVWTNSTI